MRGRGRTGAWLGEQRSAARACHRAQHSEVSYRTLAAGERERERRASWHGCVDEVREVSTTASEGEGCERVCLRAEHVNVLGLGVRSGSA